MTYSEDKLQSSTLDRSTKLSGDQPCSVLMPLQSGHLVTAGIVSYVSISNASEITIEKEHIVTREKAKVQKVTSNIYVYIYIYRERERERACVCVCERERERERAWVSERERDGGVVLSK